MKIFYAIQATGNGHISRAMQLYPYLQKFGEVDFFLSGNNATLPVDLPVKYSSKGCSLLYSKYGGLDYLAIAKNIKPLKMYNDAKSLPLKQYDVIINDFESVTALACRLQKVNSVQFGHQASFISHLHHDRKKEVWLAKQYLNIMLLPHSILDFILYHMIRLFIHQLSKKKLCMQILQT